MFCSADMANIERCPKPPGRWFVAARDQRDEIVAWEGVSDIGFVQPSELPRVFLEHGAYVIASRYEPWGVAIVFRKLKLRSFRKFTGGRGLHIVVPVRPEYDWNQVKSFAHAFTLQMEHENPQLYISKMTKSARKNKIFVDYLRNERGATAIAPYSPRARSGVGAALPLAWSELDS